MFLLGTAFAAKNRTLTPETYWKMWNEFHEAGNRYLPDILTGEEHDSRFEIFMGNVDRITEHNAKDLSWKMGHTGPFADMTAAEFKSKVVTGYCHDRFETQKQKNQALNKLDNGRRLETPSSVNWVTAGKVTGVKNQGQCGSCWAFSTTGCIEARTSIATGKYPVSLSEQELVDCSSRDAGCNGGAMSDGFLYAIENKGLCLEEEYSYTASDGSCKSTSCTHYSPVSDQEGVNYGEEYLETAVAAGPVSIAIEADQMSFQLYSYGVFSGDCGTSLDHGVLAAGYSNDASDGAYWLVKNSWGSGWGEAGYIRMCKDCDKNDGAGQCGLASAAVYAII